MTPKSEETDTARVIQADRDAAADMLDAYRGHLAAEEHAESAALAVSVRAGLRDGTVRVQAFARHRLAASAGVRDGWRDTVMFVAKWVERGLFDKNVSAKEALEVIAHYPGMPFKNGRWDVDHKDYTRAFYAKFPKAAAPDVGEG